MRAHETPRGWRKNKSSACPACKGVSGTGWNWQYAGGDGTQWNICPHCGNWFGYPQRSEGINAAKDHGPYKLADFFRRPDWMGADEHAFRLELCRVYLTKPIGEYRRQLEVFADFLGDQGSPEEAAARADWRPRVLRDLGADFNNLVEAFYLDLEYRSTHFSLVVRVADGWWDEVDPGPHPNPPSLVVRKVRAQRRFGIPIGATNQSHNGDWFLGWPPGWVKFTQPGDDPKWWWVTIEPGRSLVHSAPIEHKRIHGYTEFFHAPTP
jgi:hypothetical protein